MKKSIVEAIINACGIDTKTSTIVAIVSVIEAIIGVIAIMLLIRSIGVLTALDMAQYMYGASIGFISGTLLVICLHHRENAKKKRKKDK